MKVDSKIEINDFQLNNSKEFFKEVQELIEDELTQEQAKTHKEILTEAFEECGIKLISSGSAQGLLILRADDLFVDVNLTFKESSGKLVKRNND